MNQANQANQAKLRTGGGNETHTIGLANINERGVFGKLVSGFEQACEAREDGTWRVQ